MLHNFPTNTIVIIGFKTMKYHILSAFQDLASISNISSGITFSSNYQPLYIDYIATALVASYEYLLKHNYKLVQLHNYVAAYI